MQDWGKTGAEYVSAHKDTRMSSGRCEEGPRILCCAPDETSPSAAAIILIASVSLRWFDTRKGSAV